MTCYTSAKKQVWGILEILGIGIFSEFQESHKIGIMQTLCQNWHLDWIGLNWIGLDWIGLDGCELDWIGLEWIGLEWIILDFRDVGKFGSRAR